jgi:Arc/MetJ family transcription regulator
MKCALNHSMCMKRTNLVLDENILEQTLRISQKKTYSEAVMIAMKEFIRTNEFSKIFEFQGTGIWSGDLSEMRKDAKVVKKKKKSK